MQQPRLLFYAVNGLGLGHVTRLLALARALRRLVPGAEVLFVTASEASHIIYREGFAALKVPSRAAASAGGLRRGSFLRLTQSVIWNAVTAFDPHCLVVDTFAAGSSHELLPLLRWPLRKVFVFRAQRPERANDAFLQSTLRLYDLILVPHAAGSEEVPTPAAVETVWTGPMLGRDASDLLPRATARAALSLPGDGDIGLITLGGGGEPEGETARAQLGRALAAGREMVWVEAEGPLARRAPPSNTPAEQAPWPILRDVHPLVVYLNAFDCAIAAVGYNTTHELQAAAIPTLFWPFARDVDDQAARAFGLARQGRALCVSEGTGENEASELQRREKELGAAIAELVKPATRQRLRENLARAAAGQAPWTSGALAGAQAICRLLER